MQIGQGVGCVHPETKLRSIADRVEIEIPAAAVFPCRHQVAVVEHGTGHRTDRGTASVEPTTESADLTLDTTDLAAAYLGTFSFAELARANRGEEATPGARARADALFRVDVLPWCSTPF